jgi:hypothetical protein
MGWTYSTRREKRKVCRILEGRPEEKRPLGRARRRWEDTIKIDFRKIGWGCYELD